MASWYGIIRIRPLLSAASSAAAIFMQRAAISRQCSLSAEFAAQLTLILKAYVRP
jgi:hypothetical protein